LLGVIACGEADAYVDIDAHIFHLHLIDLNVNLSALIPDGIGFKKLNTSL
jgi:hypothetical protein